MCNLGNIFQSKLYYLLGDIDGIKPYIDVILLLIKDRFYNKIEQLIIIIGILHDADLKVNDCSCIIGLKGDPCLSYVIMW